MAETEKKTSKPTKKAGKKKTTIRKKKAKLNKRHL